jgi:hypothetical protein
VVLLVALVALLSAVLQVSLYNRFYVLYRAQSGGDQTSKVTENAAAGYPGDDPVWLHRLHLAYQVIYGWQDALVGYIDDTLAPHHPIVTANFLTAASVLGLGTQLLVIAITAVFGAPIWSLFLFLTLFNAYAIILLVLRRA